MNVFNNGNPNVSLNNIFTQFFNSHGSSINKFTLYSEKRHKEAMIGKKFDKRPTSSQVRHHRIVGRGGGIPRIRRCTKLPAKPIILPARRCMLLGKMDNTKAIKRSHSGVRTKRTQKLNLHWKKIWHPEKKYFIRLRLSMRGLKTIKRLGIIEAARRFHLDINNKKLFAGYARLKERYALYLHNYF
ncbi:50S ribosomal protein L28 [Theileria orientalis strain Shintoku]|uniref:Large ribosomal subunit protein bL28c n=1 Tax=Theileria orientalis strain Shintoku TaxID=869250 RepID=J4C8A5_THEOR|nr:50S ribosomal protein L28 [Theileria orientalis strain Shintoku]PVC52149.1 50S ribosomal protein L28 [Theileria orientalis]BAM40448.1 50S ribosomal protein L28 [Theileria orientalis strain Shintoku]|eukprot:XP_009690749.1 50S ribosomal protein L28 [Theileria orientalis strain Shintoku]